MSGQWQRKREILTHLNNGEFISGESLAEILGVSRAAIGKQIAGLAEYGIDVFSVKGKGYKLSNPVFLINESELLANITNRCFYFDEIASTNAFLLEHLDELQSGDTCIAEFQSAGRGRRGRRWVSPYGSHLYFSMFWHLPQGMTQAMGLSLVVACSLVSVLTQLGAKDVGVKWPNDIFFEHRKLAGVLIEMSGTADSGCNLVIGIGVNIAMAQQQGELIDQPWSDLQQMLVNPDKTILAKTLQQQLHKDLKLFEQKGLAAFTDRWHAADIYLGKPVRLLLGNDSIHGRYLGIDEQGGVILETASGQQHFVGGEISLRGV
ncbi:bifunctional biotin--[acetyl-CoA-carboxylase] ligase/biotin operon repressor BirA [Shewanella sp. A32]|uniref:bifunctional biotin--[acetyl-CoA-carboxylase] ligase/biotin operon repressor BirA n=1 Tax=Shewanella sp. A32 TaxID=3031327 RepID=UPI0023B8F48C|nr:bifunctional biotin--[acetyl-CoA-carboxylase] ligase/biotin operon repressor BirA [Shewanella sp. A32]MDF0535964.1 bifunctional biotin--[acetyl-CoA-carboxylase] ligase/biotin operon repressor BirA [Shewanella sp. A32]